jgi:hypothetical protein
VLKRSLALLLPMVFCLLAWSVQGAAAQEAAKTSPAPKAKPLTLVEASVCETMKGGSPVDPAIVFSASLGKIYCFTSFDPVPREMDIYHEWYRKDKLKAKVKLTLKPPRWSTFSSMRIRKSDQGPWQIHVTDPEGRVLKTLQFSITE